MTCTHSHPTGDNWHVHLDFHELHDDPTPGRIDHRVMDLKLTCKACGEPMHFLGVDVVGARFDGPAVSIDGTTVSLPFAPGAKPVIPSRIVVQMPWKKAKN